MKQFSFRIITILIVLLLLTPARVAAILLAPLLLWLLRQLHPYRIQKGALPLLSIWIISSILGIIAENTTIQSTLLALIICLPMLTLMFAVPMNNKTQLLANIQWISKVFILVLIVINMIGGIIWFNIGGDEWGTAYGTHYEYVHGLAMVNIMIVLYLGIKFFSSERNIKTSFLLLFFCISIFGCQYGLGYICLFTSLLIFLIMMRRFKMLLGAGVVIGLTLFIFSLDAFQYERSNILRAERNDGDTRKLEMAYDFIDLLKNDTNFLLIGTGAGGYNSRTTLTLSHGKDNAVKSFLGEVMPPYYSQYIHPLWNDSFVSMESYTDGTRNKPYSSFVSIWAEHGIFFFLIFCGMVFKNFQVLYHYRHKNELIFRYLLLLDLFMLISMISHLWLETSEFLVYALIRFTMLAKLKTDNKKNLA